MLGRRQQINPLGEQEPRIPHLSEVSGYPAIFDARTQAWRIYMPDSPEARDPSHPLASWPRQKALASCNILQLFERLEILMRRYQTEFFSTDDKPNLIIMPYQFIPPEPGWKLKNGANGREYVVKSIQKVAGFDGVPVFNGRIILENSTDLEPWHPLSWMDPEGQNDGQTKVVTLSHADDLRSIMEVRSSAGDVADARTKPFVPKVGYCMARQEPASTKGGPFAEAREIKPRIRRVLKDTSDPRLIQKELGWWLDTLVDFECVAVGGKVAERLAVWLRNFILRYTSVLTELGVNAALYWSTRQSEEVKQIQYDLSIKRVQYYFRLEELMIVNDAALQTFDISLQILSSEEAFPAESSEIYPSNTTTSDQYAYGDIYLGE